MSVTYVYSLGEGTRDMKDLLGGKGAGLSEMARLGLPVPPGFTITTEACRAYLASGDEPPALQAQVDQHLAQLESATGRQLGDAEDPLLVSVRSGAKFSMPGMMETVLDIGLNDRSVEGLARRTDDPRFAWDSYRRLIAMFGATVLGIPSEEFAAALAELKERTGARNDLDLGVDDLRALVDAERAIVARATGADFPQAPRAQLDAAVRAVFSSWNAPRAQLYRRQEHIPDDLGTAVNVVAMVFGNLGSHSGTGVAFTRDPATGRKGVYGDYLQNAQGEDVVAGIRNTLPLGKLQEIDPTSYSELLKAMDTLEHHYRDLCDIEFTIERGKLWMLQTRVGKRTAEAAFSIATHLVDEGTIDMDEALRRVTGEQLTNLMFPQFAAGSTAQLLGTGMNASPGAAVGRAVFDCETAVREHAAGNPVVLVRRETTPDDLDGMIASEGILTSHGGRTSHAAVVARGMGKCCVCGAEDLLVDAVARMFTTPDGTEVHEGDVISVDGTTGKVYLGTVDVVDPPVVDWFEGRTEGGVTTGVVDAVRRLLEHADSVRRLGVRANADTAPDAARAVRFGAEGIGLCRTEHMFLGERRPLVEHLVLAEDDDERDEALRELEVLQRQDFEDLLVEMDGKPVTVRLIDPPLHEFLPDLTALSVKVALAAKDGAEDDDDIRLLAAVRRLHEQNPMLGLRGVRLGIAIPGLVRMQVRALAQAACVMHSRGLHPELEIMVPLVATEQELHLVRLECEKVLAELEQESGIKLNASIGTMIELPRAALTAGDIARSADFFSFGTNDLTQTTWGFSRDDVEHSFFPRYIELGIFESSPFEQLDRAGVGRLVSIAVAEGKATRASLRTGVCGEHGGDPASVRFFHGAGVDYVSCSPYRVPVARLEAGRAAVLEKVSADAGDTR